MHKMEKEVLKASQQDAQTEGEERQDYLERLVRAAAALEDDGWESLSEAARDWVNAGAEQLQAEKDIVDFGGKPAKAAAKPAKAPAKPAKAAPKKAAVVEEDTEQEEVEEDPEEEEVEEPAPKGKAKAAAKPAKAAANGKAPRAARGMSPAMFVRHHLATHPQDTVDEIAAALSKSGLGVLSQMTIQSLRNEFRAVCRVLNEKGHFKRGTELTF